MNEMSFHTILGITIALKPILKVPYRYGICTVRYCGLLTTMNGFSTLACELSIFNDQSIYD